MKLKIILVFLISFLCSGNSIIKPDELIMFKKIAYRIISSCFLSTKKNKKRNVLPLFSFLAEDGIQKIKHNFIVNQSTYHL